MNNELRATLRRWPLVWGQDGRNAERKDGWCFKYDYDGNNGLNNETEIGKWQRLSKMITRSLNKIVSIFNDSLLQLCSTCSEVQPTISSTIEGEISSTTQKTLHLPFSLCVALKNSFAAVEVFILNRVAFISLFHSKSGPIDFQFTTKASFPSTNSQTKAQTRIRRRQRFVLSLKFLNRKQIGDPPLLFIYKLLVWKGVEEAEVTVWLWDYKSRPERYCSSCFVRLPCENKGEEIQGCSPKIPHYQGEMGGHWRGFSHWWRMLLNRRVPSWSSTCKAALYNQRIKGVGAES